MHAMKTLLCLLLVSPCIADLNLLVFGDWGHDTAAQYADAKGMETVAESLELHAGVLLGDNFYSSGIHGDDHSSRFQTTFENVYNGTALQNLPFYAIGGNHDHKGNVTAQLCYTNDSKRWNYPTWWYSKVFDIPGTNKTFEMLLFDSVIGLGNTDDNEDPFDQPPGPSDPHTAAAQWAWLEESLANSKADYLWVGAHYPVWSICQHGPTLQLVLKLKPLLEHYGAHFMNGHDHCLGHIDEGKGPQYITAGAGMSCCYADSKLAFVPKGSVKFWASGSGGQSYQKLPVQMQSGFSTFRVGADSMKVVFHAHEGTELYTTPEIKPRASVPPPMPPSPPSPPSPSPTPSPPLPPPAGKWECHTKHTSHVGTDTDVGGKAGSTISGCQSYCEKTPNCASIVWHNTDNHCHYQIGNFSHDDFTNSLKPDNAHDTCFLLKRSSEIDLVV